MVDRKVNRLWFDKNRIYIELTSGAVMSQSLLHYPTLYEATEQDRKSWIQNVDGIRWVELDEDISFESFEYKEEEPIPNEISAIFREFPELNVSAVARRIGINKSLLSKYIYGIVNPSLARVEQVKHTIKEIGRQMQMI